MTLFDYTKDLFKDGVEIFNDQMIITRNNATLTRDARVLRELSLAAISTTDAMEWYSICRLKCPIGTIIEDFCDVWNQLYSDVVLLCRVALTKGLLNERNKSSATTLMKILEKRDPHHWSEKKDIELKGNTNQQISISIVGV